MDGLIGVFSENTRNNNFCTQYKSLWMRYTYLRLSGPVALFYTSAAAIKSERFKQSGGFDINYKRPSVEDTAMGLRLTQMGCRIYVNKDLAVEHNKAYSLFGLLKLILQELAIWLKWHLETGFYY